MSPVPWQRKLRDRCSLRLLKDSKRPQLPVRRGPTSRKAQKERLGCSWPWMKQYPPTPLRQQGERVREGISEWAVRGCSGKLSPSPCFWVSKMTSGTPRCGRRGISVTVGGLAKGPYYTVRGRSLAGLRTWRGPSLSAFLWVATRRFRHSSPAARFPRRFRHSRCWRLGLATPPPSGPLVFGLGEASLEGAWPRWAGCLPVLSYGFRR